MSGAHIDPQLAAMATVADMLALTNTARLLRMLGRVQIGAFGKRRFMGNGYAMLHARLTGRALAEAYAISVPAHHDMRIAWLTETAPESLT